MIVFRHGDKIPGPGGSEYTLNLEDVPEILAGTDDPGCCVEGETIYVRLDVGDPRLTFLHEHGELWKWELLGAGQKAMEDILHE